MKKELKKGLLGAIKKTAEINAGNQKLPYCPVIFHQPKRPVKNEK